MEPVSNHHCDVPDTVYPVMEKTNKFYKDLRVRLISKDKRLQGLPRVEIGQEGRVLATRLLPGDPEFEYLVKFDGKAGPVSVSESQLEGVE